MADSEIQALRAGPEIVSGAALPFRFEITWRSVTRSLEPTGATAVTRISAPPVRRTPPRDTEAKEWEMVLPRMKKRVTAVFPAVMESVAAPVAAPSFALAADAAPSRFKRIVLVVAPLAIVSGLAAM